jgi:hypothetical protein
MARASPYTFQTETWCSKEKKLYIADFSNLIQDRQSYLVKTNMKGKEVCARVACELVHRSGYPLLQEAIHIVQDSNMTHMPGIMAEDMQ